MNSKVSMVLRILLGLVLLIFGANKFANFMPAPEMSGDATEFMTVIGKAGYFKILGILEIVIGLLLILNKWVPFALLLLAPLAVNFLIFHLQYNMAGIGGAALVSVLLLILIYANWNKYKTLF